MTDERIRDEAEETEPEKRVEQLSSEIDETRGALSETAQAIGDKLDPANIARDATDNVRQAALGKVEHMTYGAQETWRDVRTGNTGGLVDMIRSNPVPAGMVALGLGMLFMNRGQAARSGSRFYGRQGWERDDWRSARQSESPLDGLGSTVASVGRQAGETVGRIRDEAGQAVSDKMEDVGETAAELPRQAERFVEQGTSQVRDLFDDNPLAVGVVAVAAGAAIGMLLPATRLERETLGEARDHLVGQVEATAHEALDRVEAQAGSTV